MRNFLLLCLLLLQTDFSEPLDFTYYLEFKTPPTTQEMQAVTRTYNLKTLKPFYKRAGLFWQKYYEATSLHPHLETINHPLLANIETPIKANVLSIEPSQNGEPASKDTFIRYQWALDNAGQTIYRETDDTHPLIASSKVGFDVQWKELQKLLANKNLHRPVVAVIDSGLTTSHEEIAHAIYKNEIECRNGNRIEGATEDNDNNSFIGDCLGWNFTTDNVRRRNDVIDDIGHGSHISGIIAAKTNDVGISGLWDQIQILPLKVYSTLQEGEQAPFIQRVAKAILYAIDRKVDVINLSLGWPLISDLPVVRNAIQEALKAKIVIVAGAGNDGHSAKVLPCAYEGVICVGASGIDGSLPAFTNYGGQVDILAPGERILSILPATLISKQFGLRKYDLMNGTSQATPYVSAAVAVLKAYFPGITSDEILARLRSSAKNDLDWGSKYAAAGLLQSASAITQSKTSYIAPVFKNIDLFFVNTATKQVELQIPIKNYWASTTNIKIEISSPQLRFSQNSYTISKLQEGQTQLLRTTAILEDLSSDYASEITLKISYNNKTERFKHQGFFSIRSAEIQYQTLEITPGHNLQSINDYEQEGQNAEFYSLEKVESGLKLNVFRPENQQLKLATSVTLPKVTSLYPHIGITRVDLNLDGIPDYFITATIKEENVTSLVHYTFDKNLKPLYGKYSSWRFVDEGLLIHPPSLQFAIYQSPVFGKIRIPAFLQQQIIPRLDQNPDPFEPFTLKGRGLYVLQPNVEKETVLVKTRLVNNYSRNEALQKQFHLRFNEDISLLYYDINAEGNLRTIFAAGLGINLKYLLITFNPTNFSILTSRELQLGDIDLRYQGSRKVSATTVAFFGIFRNNFGQLSLLNLDTGFIETHDIESDSIANGVVSVLAINHSATLTEAFVETVDTLFLFRFTKNQAPQKIGTPIYRFSYLPGQFFTDIFFPLKLDASTTGIYVDSSNINVRNVHLWLSSQKGLESPVKYSVQLPNNCRALTPRRLLANESYASYLFLCKDNERFYVQKIPLMR